MAATEATAEIEIDGRRIGPAHPPYLIAEVSANHGGDLDRALRIIDLAAEAGADAVKFQAYTADSITIDVDRPEFRIGGDSLWSGRRFHELYASAATPYEWFPELFARARARGVTPFASAFGNDAVEMLEGIDAPAYKVASFEANDPALIAAMAGTGKPIIISTGLCAAEEVDAAYAAAREGGARGVALLKCTSDYPAKIDETNLLTILDMRRRYPDAVIGFSDHTLGVAAATAACALGAAIVEKHVIDAREPATADSEFSLLPDELAALVCACRDGWAARGVSHYGPAAHEAASRAFRRSLYAVADIAAGAPFTAENVRSIRPGAGLPPSRLSEVLGRAAARSVARGEPLSEDMLG